MSSPIHSLGIPPVAADIKNPQPVGEAADGGEQFNNLLSDAIAKVENYR